MINQPVKEKNRIKSSAIFSRWLRGWPSKSLTADDTTGSRSDILPAALHLLRDRGNSQLCGGPDATHCPVIKDKPGPTDWLIFEGRSFYPWRAKCTQKMIQTKFHILTEEARALQIHLERKKSTLDPLSVSQVHYEGITCNDQPSMHPIHPQQFFTLDVHTSMNWWFSMSVTQCIKLITAIASSKLTCTILQD
jgi:hypothetical protein